MNAATGLAENVGTLVQENQRVVIPAYGPASILKLISEPLPVPGEGEVRLRVEAAGVSFGDVLQRNGLFFAGAPAMPYTPGYDVVGVVDAVGPNVTKLLGARVAAFTLFGGYAQYVCVPVDFLVADVPEDLDAAQIVAMIMNYTTAFQMLTRAANVRRGQTILVYGASGGVGSALLDLAQHLGLVVAAVMSKRWHESFQSQAALLVDERDPGSHETLRQFRPHGFDAAFDSVGGSHVWRTRSLVAKNGKLIAFGIGSAVKPDGKRDRAEVLRLGLLLAFAKVWQRPSVELYALDQRVKTRRGEIHDDIRMLIGLLRRGALHPKVGATFALGDAARAHELLESRNNVGKIVLIP